jgi:hypothetical protein
MIDPKRIKEWEEDWVSYERLATSFPVRDAVPALLAERAELLALLREVEWAPSMASDTDLMGEDYDRCPKCLMERRDAHAPGCRLAAALRGTP